MSKFDEFFMGKSSDDYILIFGIVKDKGICEKLAFTDKVKIGDQYQTRLNVIYTISSLTIENTYLTELDIPSYAWYEAIAPGDHVVLLFSKDKRKILYFASKDKNIFLSSPPSFSPIGIYIFIAFAVMSGYNFIFSQNSFDSIFGVAIFSFLAYILDRWRKSIITKWDKAVLLARTRIMK